MRMASKQTAWILKSTKTKSESRLESDPFCNLKFCSWKLLSDDRPLHSCGNLQIAVFGKTKNMVI